MTPFEVEIKFPAPPQPQLLAALEELQAAKHPLVRQEDLYLAHPTRDFRQTNEALRIRRQDDQNHITYKGPKLPGPTKSRPEIELQLESGPQAFDLLVQLFQNLGFQPVALVRKERQPYALQVQGRSVILSLDIVEQVGPYLEIETIAQSQDDLANAQSTILHVAQLLGLEPSQAEPRSYLRMLLESQARQNP
jgi:adenylate cyclase class 2